MLSNGALIKSQTQTIWSGPLSQWQGWNINSALLPASYAKIYRSQLWVNVLVSKRSKACTRLPLKTYYRDGDNRPEAAGHPYQRLLNRPSTTMSPKKFWRWVWSTGDIFNVAPIAKKRDNGGRPIELLPIHPTRLIEPEKPGSQIYHIVNSDGSRTPIHRRDLILHHSYNPEQLHTGLSPLEPLRSTLENEAGARAANASVWRNGGRPSVVLRHPKNLSDPAQKRLSSDWDRRHAGVENWSQPVVLEEGMTFEQLSQTSEDLQYIDTRKLNREEICAVYDVPPTLVGILDKATFSNVSAQMISLYRDTIAPLLSDLESTLDFELRDGRFGGGGDPDFGEGVYAEFLLDEVMRGDWAARTTSYQKMVHSGLMTPAEVRSAENLPFIDGSDQLLINGTLIPLAAAGIDVGVPDEKSVRSLMGRLGRAKDVDSLRVGDLDPDGKFPELIEARLADAIENGWSIEDLRAQLREDLP